MPRRRDLDLPTLATEIKQEEKGKRIEGVGLSQTEDEQQKEQRAATAEIDKKRALEQAERIREKIQKNQEEESRRDVLSLNELSETDRVSVDQSIRSLSHKKTSLVSALFTGNKTATEYDSKVANFSTKNGIVELSDGRKVFVINSRGSGTHRFFDGLMKRMTGCEMQKAKAKDWKHAFESKSDIPVIENSDPNTVVLPFVPNVNAYDAFVNRKEIGDFGECDYLEDMDESTLLELADSMMQKIQELHQKGIAWGEVILPNFIIDTNKKAYICDPEVRYSDRISLIEQKARDLLDFLHSLSAAMNQSEGTDYQVTIQRMLDQYGDKEVLGELLRLAEKKQKLLERIFFGYTQVRLGQRDKKEFKEIRKAIQDVLTA